MDQVSLHTAYAYLCPELLVQLLTTLLVTAVTYALVELLTRAQNLT